MSVSGSILIDITCPGCGHSATLGADQLGCEPERFMAFHRLRCSACGRQATREDIIKSWHAGETTPPYRGSYRRE